MARAFKVRGIRIYAQTTPCAHACRYCLVGPKRLTRLAPARFFQFVERFISWRAESRDPQLRILAGLEDSFEFDIDTLRGLFQVHGKLGWNSEHRGIKLGGLKWRTDAEMKDWLMERRDKAGLKIVHGSFAGFGAVHDSWNGRQGDFGFLVRTMTTAAELGMRIHQRLFVVESTVPTLEALLDALDAVPGEALRYLSTFVYRGRARVLEHERITEATRNRLPTRVTAVAKRNGDRWLSEREWLAHCREEIEAEAVAEIDLELRVTDANIDDLERTSCEDIMARLVDEAVKANAAIPSRAELHLHYSDPANRCIYASLAELEEKWLSRYEQKHGLGVEQEMRTAKMHRKEQQS